MTLRERMEKLVASLRNHERELIKYGNPDLARIYGHMTRLIEIQLEAARKEDEQEGGA